MGWAEDKDTLLAGGYSEPEVQSIAGGIADHMSSNGYSPEDMADYFGRPKEPPTGKLTEYFNQQFKAHLPNEDAVKEAGHADTRLGAVVDGIKNGWVSGYQSSDTGLRLRKKLPDVNGPGTPDDSVFDTTGDKITNAIASTLGGLSEGVSGLVSDAPVFWAGAQLGGQGGAATGGAIGSVFGPGGSAVGAGIGALLGAGGGAFAMQRAARAALMQAYSEGGVQSFSQFVDVAKTAAVEGTKGFLIGAPTAGVGAFARLGAGMVGEAASKAISSRFGIGGFAAAAFPIGSELAAMTAAGAAVDGKMPEMHDFVQNALLMVGAHNLPAFKGAREKLGKIFTDTAAHPHDVVADALMDPVLKQQLLAQDNGTPPALSHLVQPDIRSSQALVGSKLIPSQEAAIQGHFDFEGTPADFAKKTEGMFHPEERAKVARAHDPVAFKTVADLSSEVKRLNSEIEAGKDTEGLSPEHISGLQNELDAHKTRLDEIKENGEAVKSRIADAYAQAHETLTENLKDHLRNAKLNFAPTPESQVSPVFNPEFTSQEDSNLFIHDRAKEGIIEKDADLKKLMGRHANFEPEDGVRDTLAKHPELAKIISPEMVKETSSPEGKKTLRILPPTKKPVEKLALSKFLEKTVDDLQPWNDLSNDFKKQVGRFPLSNPRAEILHSRAYLNRAWSIIGSAADAAGERNFGVFDPKTGEKLGESLHSIFADIPNGDIQTWREYGLYKQAIDEHAAGRATGVDLKEAQDFVAKHPEFEDTAKRFTALNNTLNDFAESGGVLSPEANKKFKEAHPNYFTGNRVNEDQYTGSGRKNADIFKSREGATLPYLDPVISFIRKVENITRAVELNRGKLEALKANQEYVDNGLPGLFKTDPKKVDLEGNATDAPFEKQASPKKPLREGEMGYFDNGVYKKVEFKDPKLAQLINGAAKEDHPSVKIITAFLKPFADVQRFAISTGTNFNVNHIIRSELFTSTIAPENHIPFVSTLGFLKDAFGANSKEFVQALNSGALDGVMSDVNQQMLNDRKYTLGDEHGALGATQNVLKTVAQVGHVAIQTQETAKRMAVFDSLKQNNPNATWDELRDMGKKARLASVDGLQRGSAMQAINSVIPFMHYEIQGLARNAMAWKENPAQMAGRTALMAGITIMNWYANKDDEDIQNLPDFQKNAFWNFKVGDTIVKVAKDWGEGKVVCTLIERTLDYFANHNPRALDGFADTLKNIVPVPFINRHTTFGETYDALVNNVNDLTHQNVIPKYLMDQRAPISRAMPYTSEIGKMTAGVLGHLNGLGMNLDSPIMVDYAIKQFTGDNGVALIRATETVLEKAGVIPPTSKPAYEAADLPYVGAFISRHPTYNAQPLKDFGHEYVRLKQNYTTYQDFMKAGNLTEAQDFMDKNPDLFNYQAAKGAHKAIIMATKQIQNYNVMPNDRMSPSDKKQASEDLYKTSISIAKQTLNQLDNMRENSR